MMSAILGTLYWEEVPNSAVVFVVLRAAAGLQIDGTQSWPRAHSRTAPTTVHSAPFSNPPPRRPPKLPIPRQAPLSAHALSYKEAEPDKQGERPEKKESSALSGTLSRAPRRFGRRTAPAPRSSPAGPAPTPPTPWPSDLAVHGDRVVGDDERLLAALGLALLGLLLGQSRVERHLHHGAVWGALGGRRWARDAGCGLLAATAASSAGLRARLSGGGAGYCSTSPAASQLPDEDQDRSLSAGGGARGGWTGVVCGGRGRRRAGWGPAGGPDVQIRAESDPALSPGRRRDVTGKGAPACGPGFCSFKLASNQFTSVHNVAAV